MFWFLVLKIIFSEEEDKNYKPPPTRENFVVDPTVTLSNRSGYLISRTNALLLCAVIFCVFFATIIIVYNFSACEDVHPEFHPHASTECSHYGPSINHVDATLAPSITSSTKLTSFVPHTTIAPKSEMNSSFVDVRLPRSIVPIAYNLSLIPFLAEGNFTFKGHVRIRVEVKIACKNVTLHAASIIIHSVRIHSTKGEVRVLKRYPVETKQFLVIEVDRILAAGEELEVEIRYEGVLNDYLQGFYRSSYTVGNETRWLAATQFQPTDCRRAFPAFDEPALKAKFSISIARPKHMKSLSNMPLVKTIDRVDGVEDYVWDVYDESVPMSTYLVAFIVCDFVSLQHGNFAVWARADAINSAKYALDFGVKVLEWLENFFDLKYPMPKMDMIAVPDFSSGAMENFGLITFRETGMLFEDGISAHNIKQRIAIVVAHELAHQWFGNLVTPSWWVDLWLNEGFASYMEYLGVDAIEPSWKSMDQFIVNDIQGVFSLDALSSSHPISIKVGNPDEINEIFDKISYEKGAAIIRMMAHFLTDRVFREGLSNYLRDKSFQSAEQDDLWAFLTAAARRNGIFDESLSVKAIMDTWTLQTGFPVINVTRNYAARSVDFTQSRFVLISAAENDSSMGTLWWVPITYTHAGKPNFSNTKPIDWMRQERSITLKDVSLAPLEWILVNIQLTGYYRVNYDLRNWRLLIGHLRNPIRYREIAASNRAQLIDDALNLARGGYLDYRVALDITEYLIHEEEYVPWKAAISAMNFIDTMFIKSGEYALFKKYFLHKLSRIYEKVGFEDRRDSSDLLTVYKRVDVLTAACHLGHRDCIDNCIRKFHIWMNEGSPDLNNPISPNLKNVVYCIAIKYGDETQWEFAWKRFQNTRVSSEKEILLSAMGCTRETWILNRYLERAMSDEYGIRKQDVYRVFGAVSNNVIGQPIVFDFMKKNWSRLKSYFGQSMIYLNHILKYATRRLNSPFELEELKEFAKVNLKESGRTVQQAIEKAEANIAWMDKNYQTIVDWLKNTTEYLD